MAADQADAYQATTEIPLSLRRTLEDRETEPLVRIAAARVLRRFPWRGDAATEARAYLAGAPEVLQEEARKPEFYPVEELRQELREVLGPAEARETRSTRRILEWSVEHFKNAQGERSLDSGQEKAVEETLQFLQADVRKASWFSRDRLKSLRPEDIGYFATGGFARSVYAAYGEDPDARQALGNEIVKVAAPVWSRLQPKLEPLFQVYLSLYPGAERYWMQWKEEYGGKSLPNFIPTSAGQLSVSWQVSWAAAAAQASEFLSFLDQSLKAGNARRRLAALNFTEFAIRFGAGGEAPVFGGSTIAPDVPGVETAEEVSPGVIDLGIGKADMPAPPVILMNVPGLDEDIEELAPPQATKEPGRPALSGAPILAPPSAQKKPIPEIPSKTMVDPSNAAIPPDEPPIAPDQVPREPGKRFADFTFYRQLGGGKKIKVQRHEPLGMEGQYDLEVAVRAKVSGVPLKRAKERVGISEPMRGEPVEVLVIAESKDFEIPEPAQFLTLPPAGDSLENAIFTDVKPLRSTPSVGELATIEIRLLYNLNLIEQVVIEAEVIQKLPVQPSSKLGLADPVVLEQILEMREYHNFDLIQPRQMNIVVRQVDGGFELKFTLLREGRREEVLTGVSKLSEGSLEKSLADIRKTLLGISMWEEFGNSTECKDATKFEKASHKLASKGQDLWNKLFNLNINSAIATIGKFLFDNPLPDESLIQISIHKSATSFVLPWNLLYDRAIGEMDADPRGFWGLRYRIEQQIEGSSNRTDEPQQLKSPLEIGFIVSRFQETALQERFLKDTAAASRGKIAAIAPIDTAADALDYLKNKVKQLVVFFSHGHTQFPEAGRVGCVKSDVVRIYESLPERSPLRKSMKELYEDIKKGQYDSDESWIKVQYGKLQLINLYGQLKKSFPGSPIFFLNMCESAQLTPSLNESFIHLFLNRGAGAVVGTECSMRPLFAHYFVMAMLKRLFSGEPIGDAMLKARTEFMAKNNPLGLAYTLFGSPLTRFEPPPVVMKKQGNIKASSKQAGGKHGRSSQSS